MTVAYFDCIGGASGDMILGALVDAGLPIDVLEKGLRALDLDGFELRCRKVSKHGFGATKVDVVVNDSTTERRLQEILALVGSSGLETDIKDEASEIFTRIGEVEAGIHGISFDEVHLHELGGIDTIVDVVGALIGVRALGLEHIAVSPFPLGHGFVEGAHGSIPLPAPATLELLKGAPTRGTSIEEELVTPTGAALLTHLASEFGSPPEMVVTAIGYGAGTRDLQVPNLLRLILGESAHAPAGLTEPMLVLETNIDDLNPELYDHVMARLFDGGAEDVFLSPIQMKKNRPAVILRALCRAAEADDLAEIMFAETSTLGVRYVPVTRRSIARKTEIVDTSFGPVRVKIARFDGGGMKYSPEYEDCRRLAERYGVPLREVYRAAEIATHGASARSPDPAGPPGPEGPISPGEPTTG